LHWQKVGRRAFASLKEGVNRLAKGGDACSKFDGDFVDRRFPVGANEERWGRGRKMGVCEEHPGIGIAAETIDVYRGFATGLGGSGAKVKAKP
jgi:hypothetical protein